MHSPRVSCLAQIFAFSIVVPGIAGAVLPPTVTKTFMPNPITDGSPGQLIITLTNPNATDLSHAFVRDVLPACLGVAIPYDDIFTPSPPACSGSIGVGNPLVNPPVPQDVTLAADTLAAGASCQLSIKVIALDFPCDNQTDAPTASGAVGISPPASASWTANAVTTATYTASVSGGAWSNNTNFGGTAVASGNNLAFPVVAQNFTTTDDVAALTIPKITVTGGGYGFNSSAPSNTLSVGELYFNLPVASTVSWNIPMTQTDDLVIRITGGGEPFFTAPITMAGNNIYVFGGNAAFSHVNGTGNVGIDAGTGTVFMSSSPAIDGTIDVTGGTFKPSVSIPQTLNIHGSGQLNQVSGTDGAVVVYGRGSTRSFGSQPGTLAVGQVSYNGGFHVVDVAPTKYSKLTATGPISFANTALQVNVNALSALPNPGDTLSNVISTTDSVSQCPAETFCDSASVFAHAVCTSTTVSVVFDANDGVFRWSGEACPPSSDTCETQTCNNGVCTD